MHRADRLIQDLRLRRRLGPPAAGALPQRVVPAGWWQAATPLDAYALVGCTVAPGFDFADFALVDPARTDAVWFRKQADARLVSDVENFILADTNLTSIKHAPEFATNKNPDTPTPRRSAAEPRARRP